MKYKHIFFDLDHTLWDFVSNSRSVLEALHKEKIVPRDPLSSVETFIDTYERHNTALWESLREGKITKSDVRWQRFQRLLAAHCAHWPLADRMELAHYLEEDFVQRTPREKRLMPGAQELVSALHGKVKLHIVTNGFEESQWIKMEYSGLQPFFDTMTTSERVGAYKPHPSVFEAALLAAGTVAPESLFVGDGWEADILGAAGIGMDQVYYNPHKTMLPMGHCPTGVVHHLLELLPMVE